MKRTVWVVMLVSAVMLTQGCTGRVLREAKGAALGASGSFAEIRPIGSKDDRPLGAYKRFELGEIKDSFGKTPGELWAMLPGKLESQLRGKKLSNEPGGKTLVISGEILHYEDASTMGVILGPLEEVIARISLVDKDSGNILGVANCIGRTKEFTTQGVAKKAEGLAKAIAGWIDSRYPKEGR